MKERFKQGCALAECSLAEVAEAIGLKSGTLRKAIDRGSINDGYLVLIEQAFGISRTWIKEGKKPIIIIREENLLNNIQHNALSVLDSIDKNKIIAYLILNENKFLALPAYTDFIKKSAATLKLKGIADRNDKK